VTKILQGSPVTQSVIGGFNYISSSCKFSIVYMCQKSWKLVGSKKVSFSIGSRCSWKS